MAGLELIFSTVCNATFCDVLYDKSPIDPVNLFKQNELLALKNDVNGKHLKIGTYNNYPMSWVERLENGTLVGRGVAFVLVDILREKFNFTYEVVTPEKNFLLGDRRSEDSLLGLVNSSGNELQSTIRKKRSRNPYICLTPLSGISLPNPKIDMAAAFFPILLKYNEMVTYSDDLDEGVWMMMLKRPKESAAGSGLLAPFDTYVWYLILAAVLTYGPFITLITWIRSKLIENDEGYISLSPSAWFVYGAFIKQGTSLSPEANTTRVSFATWWLFVMLLSAFYTANLTAFLTLSKFTLDIENPIDLYKKNYRWVTSEGGAVQYTIKNPEEDLYYLNKMILNRRAQIRSVNDNKEFLPMVTGGAVLVKEQTAVDELMYSDYLNKTRKGVPETQRCTYVMAPNPFMKKQRAFAYPKNSTLNKLFDTVLKYLIQSGIVDHLERRDLPSTRICPLDLQSKDRQLRNADLMMTYFIIITGLSIASVAFVSELIVTRYYKGKDKDVTQKTKTGKAFKMLKKDDGGPPPYDSLFGKSRYKINENLDTRVINGREYYVVHNKNGDTRLIPVRSPSAFLYR